jgi:Ca2+-binding RTX toxin-like protein
MHGGAGNDTYYVDNASDVVVEASGEGSDRVATSVSFALGSGVAIETLEVINSTSTENLTLIGNAYDQLIAGNAGANTLFGDDGIDGLSGYAGDDVLNGGAGNDSLDGGDGLDRAVYSGNRSAYTISVSGGLTTISGPDGTDTLLNVERLQFADGLFDVAGNPLGEVINGTPGADTLNGTAGPDTLNGLDGNDTLNGLAGNDILNGGQGADTMYGGAGDDTYYVDNAADVVVEAAGEGSDRVATSVSFALGSGRAIETLEAINSTGTENLTLIGNAFDQRISGNAGNNSLFGDDGIDGLSGYAGDDLLNGGAGNDSLDGGDGTDTAVYSGNRSAYTISLSGGITTITGPDGTDTLQNVERLQFANGLFDAAGGPLALPPEEGDPAVDKVGEGPQVLPASPDHLAKDAEPQVLPAHETFTPTRPGRPVAADHSLQDGAIFRALTTVDDISVDHSPAAGAQADFGFEVSPVIHDDFLLKDGLEVPPVMPVMEPDLYRVGLFGDMSLNGGLLSPPGSESMLWLSPDGLTLFGDWTDLLPLPRDDSWS